MVSKRVRPLVLSLFFTVAFTSASAETLKLATWNIEHLRDGIVEGPNPRTEADFEQLASYAKMLRADVIAFQEVENLDAASKVFNLAVYQLFISGRDARMRTGFAVR